MSNSILAFATQLKIKFNFGILSLVLMSPLLFNYKLKLKPGGLDLSRRGLDRAWSLKKVSIMSRLCREISKILDKSRFVSTISICLDDLDKYLDDLDKYLDKYKSRPKNLDFKNLDREKKKLISTWWIFSTVFKLVSTRRTISISISIGLDCRDPQGYVKQLYRNKKVI